MSLPRTSFTLWSMGVWAVAACADAPAPNAPDSSVIEAGGRDAEGHDNGGPDADLRDAERADAAALDAASPDSGPADQGVARVRLVEGRLELDGVPTFLFGGEVQYFRVRAEDFDAARTHALWRDTFARMRAGGLNLVTTYFAWDYHHLGPGQWDFTGARDVDLYLREACAAGLKVVAKPGPLITAEWPRGFGSFGAVPDWWKEAQQQALVKQPDGSNFDFAALGPRSWQPTYLHPDYLAAVGEWFDRIVPIILPHVASGCVVAAQVDNETNLYWSERFGVVDYSATSVAHYREFLRQRYGDIAALDARYGTRHASFDEVMPPTRPPEDTRENIPAQDWYDAGQAYIDDYLATIASMLAARGLAEPEVLLFTNDSPFTIVGTVANAARNVMMHDGRVKNRHGLAGLDTYPKQIPDLPGTDGPLTNFPFQADYATKLYGTFGQLRTGDASHSYVFGAELQGGFYSFPTGILPVVSAEATDQLLARTIGHGLKGGSFYILRGGLNADGSSYDFQAALALDGREHPRWDVIRRWAAMLQRLGGELQATEDVEDPVAVLQDLRYAVPQAGTQDDHQHLYSNEYPGVYGWLVSAGFNPAVVEATLTPDLSRHRALLYFVPEVIDGELAGRLADFSAAGGMLIQLLDRGRRDFGGQTPPGIARLADLFPLEYTGEYTWPRVPRTVGYGTLNQLVPAPSELRAYWYQSYWDVLPGPTVTPLLVERRAVVGSDGRLIGAEIADQGAPRALLGTHVATVYNSDLYYDEPDSAFDDRRALARYLLARNGITPTVWVDEPKALAWARRDPRGGGPLFVFVVNDGAARTLNVRLDHLDALGLDPTQRYVVREELEPAVLATRTGRQLTTEPLTLVVPRYGTRVLTLRPATD